MKYSAVLVGVVAVGGAVAQLEGLPQCAQLCVNNMLGKAQELGCSASDIACLCRNEDFRFGIRDCSNAVCNAADAATAIAFGTQFCASNAGGAVSSAAGSAISSVLTSAASAATSAASEALSSATGGAGGAGGAVTSTDTTLVTSVTGTVTDTASGSAVTTAPILSTLTDGESEQVTTVGSTTIFGVGGAANASISTAIEGAQSSGSAVLSSAEASVSSAIAGQSSNLASVSSSIRAGISSATSALAGATSTSSQAGGAIQTAAPALMGVLGLAAMLL